MQLRRQELSESPDGQGLAEAGLQRKYAGYFSAYLARKISKQS